MGNILITSISLKVPLLKAVSVARNKFNREILIFGADINENVIGKYFVDIFWTIPRLPDIDISVIIDYCLKNNICYIIPTRDNDVVYFAKNKSLLALVSIFVFSPEYETVQFCFDKLYFFESSKDKFIIPTYQKICEIEDLSGIVVKERFGSGSKKIGINLNKNDAISFMLELAEPIFQPFINGDEFSIDSYVDKDGKCLASIIRSRDCIVDGEAKITTRVFNEELKQMVVAFLEKHKISGHSVLQVIKNNQSYHCIECNTRFGGASTLSVKLGLDSFYWFLLECNNLPIKVDISTNKLKQIRIQKDIYIES